MKTFKLFWVFSLLSVALLSVSCQKTEETVIKIDLTVTGEGTFDFTSGEGSETFDVTSNVPWEIQVTSEGNWLSVDPMSGDGGKAPETVTISVKANDTGDPREGSIVITPLDGDKPEANIKTLTVKQTSSCNLTVEPDELQFETAGDETGETFTVTSNVAWKVTVPEDAEWVTVTTENNDGTGEGTGKPETVTVTATPNDTGVARQCTITITPTEGENPVESTKTVTIKQKGDIDLEVDVETLVLASTQGDKKTFTVTSNVPWEVAEPEEDWLTVSPMSGDGAEPATVTVTAAGENATGKVRTYTLTVTPTVGEQPELSAVEVEVSQNSSVSLVLDPADKLEEFGSSEGEKTFTVTANVPWSISEDGLPEWVTVKPMSGAGTGEAEQVTVSVAQNTTGKQLTGTITVVADGEQAGAEDVTKSLNVSQKAGVKLDVDFGEGETLTFSSKGDEQTFTVTSNAAWTVTKPEWVTLSPESGDASDSPVTVTATVEANETGAALTGEIVVTASREELGDDDAVVTIPVSQNASVSLVLSTETLEFTHETTPLTFTVTSNAPWTVTFENTDGAEVIRTVSPETGEASEQPTTVTVTPWANTTDAERNATITVTASLEGEDQVVKTIQVTQTPPSDTQLYFNNFDKTAVSSDTELSGTDAWKNEDPAVNGNYSYSGVLVSADSPSSGSRANNIFFDQVSYFQTPAITVNTSSAQNFVLTFSIYADTFDKNAFEVYLSGDENNWLKVDYEVDGTSGWMNASASFRVLGTPTISMYLYFATSEPGKYRLDDLKLANTAAQQQNVIRFPGEIQFGGTKEVSVKQFLAEKPNLMGKYSLTGKVTAVNGDDVTISDDEGTTTVVLKSLDLNGLAETLGEGDEVTVVGYRNVAEDGTACMSDGVLKEYTKKQEGGGDLTGTDLIISEYVIKDGKVYIELYNPTPATISSMYYYTIKFYDTNMYGSFSTGLTFYNAPSEIGSGQTVVYTSDMSAGYAAFSSYQFGATTFNGTERIELVNKSDVIDVVGSASEKPGNNDITLRRKADIVNPNPTWTPDEWEEITPADLSGLGTR